MLPYQSPVKIDANNRKYCVMRKQGKVVRWDVARGFGFIRSPETDADIFFHVKDFGSNAAPKEGDLVWFEEIHVGGRGPRAMAVQTGIPPAPRRGVPADRRPPPGRRAVSASSRQTEASQNAANTTVFLVLAWLALIGWGIWAKRLPVWVSGLALLLNLVTFYVYWLDKYAAQKRQWRTAENTLHLLSVLGGWPGAGFAQQLLRHKSRKAAFRASYGVTVFMHFTALLGWLFWLQPRMLQIL